MYIKYEKGTNNSFINTIWHLINTILHLNNTQISHLRIVSGLNNVDCALLVFVINKQSEVKIKKNMYTQIANK